MKMNKVEKLTILLIYTDYIIYIFMRQYLSMYNVRYCTIIFFLSLHPEIRIRQFVSLNNVMLTIIFNIQYIGTFKCVIIIWFLIMATCFETKVIQYMWSNRAQVTQVYYALCYPFKRQLKHFENENWLPRCVKLKGHLKNCKLLKNSLKIPKRYPETVN